MKAIALILVLVLAVPASASLEQEFGAELPVLKAAADRNGCTGELFYVLLAIRKAENGRRGRELGILHPRAINTNLNTQAGWAAATIVKNYRRWRAAGAPGDFIAFLGRRYCPVAAANDPSGLNVNWVRNVRMCYTRYAGKDLP